MNGLCVLSGLIGSIGAHPWCCHYVVEGVVGHGDRGHGAMVRWRVRILLNHVVEARNVTFVVVHDKPNDGEASHVCLRTLGGEEGEAGVARTSVGSCTGVDPRRLHAARPVRELSTVKRVKTKPLHGARVALQGSRLIANDGWLAQAGLAVGAPGPRAPPGRTQLSRERRVLRHKRDALDTLLARRKPDLLSTPKINMRGVLEWCECRRCRGLVGGCKGAHVDQLFGARRFAPRGGVRAGREFGRVVREVRWSCSQS